MLKFFRKIRQNLLAENNFSKYLLYAAGEILLVMIGILLALQINNWNETNKNRAKELSNLKSFRQELTTNKALFQRVHQIRLKALAPSTSFQEQLKAGKPTHEQFTTTMISLGPSTTHPVNGVLNTLISSGEVNLIQPDSLKYAITNWKDAANSYLSHEEAFMGMTTRIWHFGQDHFPNWDWTDYSDEQRAAIILKKVNTIPYRQRFNAYYQNLIGLIKRYDKIEADINGLLQKIDLRILELEKT